MGNQLLDDHISNLYVDVSHSRLLNGNKKKNFLGVTVT
jgi:hypothetical protein